MGLLEWLAGKLAGRGTKELSLDEIQKYIDEGEAGEICSREFFIHVAVNLIANLYSTAETRTYVDGAEKKEDEYYLWNYQPNRNQSAAEFKREIVSTLFLKNEALILEENRQLIVADGFLVREDNVLQDKIFSNVQKGNWTSPRDYRVSEVIYLKLNNANIRNMLDSVNEGYKRLAQKALADYEAANGRKGIMRIDTTAQAKKYGGKEFNEVYEDLLNNRFQKYFKAQNAVLPLFEGFNYEEKGAEGRTQKADSTADYVKVLNEQAAKTALAFNISPQLLMGNVEGLKDAVENTILFCIRPLANLIDEGINRARYGKKVLKGSYVRTAVSSIRYIDIFSVAEKVDKLVASGFATIDELRRAASMEEVGTEETRRHYITKNYERIEETEGGEENGNQDGGSGGAA
ncbi:MAG: phage portal protein [Acetatifactor muris]|nr:phage portal protein [Acetatifactor muris]